MLVLSSRRVRSPGPQPLSRLLSQLSAAYDRLAHSRGLVADTSQLEAVRRLDEYGEALCAAAGSCSRPLRPWAYMWGGVGSGKTMLLDLVHAEWSASAAGSGGPASAAADGRGTVRMHYHDLLLDTHARLHDLQKGRTATLRTSEQGLDVYSFDGAAEQADTLASVARSLARRSWLVCLDELQISDAADAAVVTAFAHHLLRHDVALLITSNQPPHELYQLGGPERQRHVGALCGLLERRCVVLRVGADGGVDYRSVPRRGSHGVARARSALLADVGAFDAAWRSAAAKAAASAASADGEAATSATAAPAGDKATAMVSVPVAFGRELCVRAAGAEACLVTFAELCGDDRGAADYYALTRHFDAVHVAAVPPLGEARAEQASRLMTLVDVAYDERCGLVLDCSAAAPPASDDAARDAWAAAQGLLPPRRRRGSGGGAAALAGGGRGAGGEPGPTTAEALFGAIRELPGFGRDEAGWRVRRCMSRLREMADSSL